MATDSANDELAWGLTEPTEFSAFYEVEVAGLTSFLIRRVVDVEVALELMAETFAQAYLSRYKFRGTSAPEAHAWLYSIAINQAKMFFRRAKVERKALRRVGLDAPTASDHEAQILLDRAELGDLRAHVRDAVGELSAEQRDALELRIVDELPYEVVATRLAISEPAARARVARGLKALADTLTPSIITEEP